MIGVLVHGGDAAARRAAVQAIRAVTPEVQIRMSSRAPEAMKCLADAVVHMVLLLDDTPDSRRVRDSVRGETHRHRTIAMYDGAGAARMEDWIQAVMTTSGLAVRDRL